MNYLLIPDLRPKSHWVSSLWIGLTRGVDDFENLGHCIAAAFIAMERYESAPEVGEGRSGNGIPVNGDQNSLLD
ncbi:Uncharacterised protein [Escherichia coli]|uniref:Uncharacterized protein n=1 Tax=Escherichia coli TaxID=562 RepID=A0A376KSH6_ECOLX|nr:Uncharacterised protein [Escherichia coli]